MTAPFLTHVHALGVGGAGMSGLARLFAARGVRVTGSDTLRSPITRALEAEGIQVSDRQDGQAITPHVDLVVRSAAIPETHPEVVAARALGIPVMKYARALGRFFLDAALSIGVAGTHGKTTTASLITHLLDGAGKNPGFLIGGTPKNFATNARPGSGCYFVAEACEYDRSFLSLNPLLGVITSIEADHLDYYRDLDEIVEAFGAFAARIPASGVLAVNAADPRAMAAAEFARCPVVTYALDAGAAGPRRPDYSAGNIAEGADGLPAFDLVVRGRRSGRLTLGMPGRHNVTNALGALAVCDWLGLPFGALGRALGTFSGVVRRFDVRGVLAGAPLIDDYAHHPTEIRATADTLGRVYPGRERWVAFQPHQRARTLAFFDAFAEALGAFDHLLLTSVFAARESSATRAGRAADDAACEALARAVRATGTPVEFLPTLDAVEQALRQAARPGRVLLTLGAGNIGEVCDRLVTPDHADRRAA